MYYRSYGNLSEDISASLFRIHGKGYDLVVGIPRSGMIPASMIALGLHIDVIGLPDFVANQTLKTRLGNKNEGKINTAWNANKILLVDDSVITGRTMQEALSAIPDECPCKIDTLAIYVDRGSSQHVDISLSTLESPRVFQWNLFTPATLSRACVDIDGVLCVDPMPSQNDDGEKYIDFLKNADPLFLPAGKIGCLVTNRLEKYRSQTESWLKQQGIDYDHLVMLDLPSKDERKRLGDRSLHKGLFYKKHNYNFFIESSSWQAKNIVKISGKAVYCCEDNRIYTPTNEASMNNDRGYSTKYIFHVLKKRVVSKFSRPIKSILRKSIH
ncbi:hypothetical protein LOS15_05225 [Halomonas sp. 7T]|uniref:phosphoribosyltransferase family protein n=1 Tax=Halomonas sp. 7T TaxID=2893469 RepID=UPI0021D8A5A6|nr:phosphoribosyltransferase family protein [Halomonas sp. 7T]UXZ55433.1 hypothetical protein LOS15_05225 [Halomonas sp. 7T]